MIKTQSVSQLKNIFNNDIDYAWYLLQAEISIEMSPIISGQQIAKLLELYMKGVEKMNSISDQRQSYFKNKVTSLMTKQAVIKSLKQNPMKKKTIHEEASCKQQTSQKKKPQVQTLKNSQKVKVSHIELKEKQKQFQMRMAYTTQQNNPQTLRRLMLQEECRQQNLTKKINSIMNNHQQRLKQRIKQRKLRTATYRTHSQFNQQSQTQPSTNKFASNRKYETYFQPPLNENKQENSQQIKSTQKKQIKKCKSLQKQKIQQQKPIRKRKYTLDLNREHFKINE